VTIISGKEKSGHALRRGGVKRDGMEESGGSNVYVLRNYKKL
jgi:hypothetical protein